MSAEIYVKVGGAAKAINPIYINVGGTWKEVTEAYINVGGSWKLAYQPLGVPSVPLNLAASSVTSSGCTLSWDAPSSDGGSSITNYEIWYSQSPTSGFTKLQDAGAATSDTVSGLTADTDYYFKVLATNASGNSDFSDVESIHTTALTIPFTPSISLTASTSSAITVAITKNASGGTPTYYDVYYRRAGSTGAWTLGGSPAYTASPQNYTLTVSLSNTHFEVAVKARNNDGSSAYSATKFRSTTRSGNSGDVSLVAATNPCTSGHIGYGLNTASIGLCGTAFGSCGTASMNGYTIDALVKYDTNSCLLRFLGDAPSNNIRSIRIYPDGNETSPYARTVRADEFVYVNHPGQYSDFILVSSELAWILENGQNYRLSYER